MAFEEGNNYGKGRPVGSKNKYTTLKEAFKEAFDELQTDADVNLVAWGKKNPKEFYRLISKLFPIEITGSNIMPPQIVINVADEATKNSIEKVIE